MHGKHRKVDNIYQIIEKKFLLVEPINNTLYLFKKETANKKRIKKIYYNCNPTKMFF